MTHSKNDMALRYHKSYTDVDPLNFQTKENNSRSP